MVGKEIIIIIIVDARARENLISKAVTRPISKAFGKTFQDISLNA